MHVLRLFAFRTTFWDFCGDSKSARTSPARPNFCVRLGQLRGAATKCSVHYLKQQVSLNTRIDSCATLANIGVEVDVETVHHKSSYIPDCLAPLLSMSSSNERVSQQCVCYTNVKTWHVTLSQVNCVHAHSLSFRARSRAPSLHDLAW